MVQTVTLIALAAGVIILSISFYKFARSDLKEIDPWHSGAVSLTGLALLGFGLFSEITVNFSDEQSVTLKKLEQIEEDLTNVQEAATEAVDQSVQAAEEVMALKSSVESSVASVDQIKDSIADSVTSRLDVPQLRAVNDRLEEVDQLKAQIEALSSMVKKQNERLGTLSSQLSSTDEKYKALLARPLPGPIPERLQEGVAGIIYFGHNDTNLSSSAKASLDDIADELEGQEIDKILVSGHADSSGNPQINLQLAKQRAERVARYLEERGLPADRISVLGLGDADPAVLTAGGTRETLNRRVVISVE